MTSQHDRHASKLLHLELLHLSRCIKQEPVQLRPSTSCRQAHQCHCSTSIATASLSAGTRAARGDRVRSVRLPFQSRNPNSALTRRRGITCVQPQALLQCTHTNTRTPFNKTVTQCALRFVLRAKSYTTSRHDMVSTKHVWVSRRSSCDHCRCGFTRFAGPLQKWPKKVRQDVREKCTGK